MGSPHQYVFLSYVPLYRIAMNPIFFKLLYFNCLMKNKEAIALSKLYTIYCDNLNFAEEDIIAFNISA